MIIIKVEEHDRTSLEQGEVGVMERKQAPQRHPVAYLYSATASLASQQMREQEEECREYAAACGYHMGAEVYRDVGGTRAALRRLLVDAQTGAIERVIISRADRLSRSFPTALA